MNSFDKYENTVLFTRQGLMHCSLLTDNFYSKIIIQDYDFSNQKIFDKICSQIVDLYSHKLLDRKNLILNINANSLNRVENFDKLTDILYKNGYSYIEFIDNQLLPNPLLENFLKENNAILCIKLDYGETLEDSKLKNLRNYLNCAKDKKNVNVHCVIRDLKTANIDGIDKFINNMYRIGINTIGLKVDEKYLADEDFLFEGLGDLFIYFFKKAKQYSFFIDVHSREQNAFLRNIIKCQNFKKQNRSKCIRKTILRLFSIFS